MTEAHRESCFGLSPTLVSSAPEHPSDGGEAVASPSENQAISAFSNSSNSSHSCSITPQIHGQFTVNSRSEEDPLFDLPWYVVRVRSRAEKSVAEHLRSLFFTRDQTRIEADALTYVATRKTSKNKRKVEVPLFSQYIFVRCDKPTARRYLHPDRTPGVVNVLMKAGMTRDDFATIPNSKLESLRLYLREMEKQEVPDILVDPVLPEYDRGVEVQITDGNFAGVRGVVQDMRGSASHMVVRIVVDSLGSVSIDVSPDRLRKV